MLGDIWNLLKDLWKGIKSIDAEKRARIAAYLKRRWKGLVAIAFSVILITVLYMYGRHAPARTVEKYFQLVDTRNYKQAWNLLGKRYHLQRDYHSFEAGYENTSGMR